MGQRAHLIVIEAGKAEIYYTHWAANTLDRDLFWGPILATEFVRQQRPEEKEVELLDEVWAEGGAILDHDHKRLLWFGGETVMYDVPSRRVHLRMMRRAWEGWTVDWAREGMVDLVDYLGVPRDVVLTREWGETGDTSRLFDPPSEPSWISSIISTVQNGRCAFLAIDVGVESLLPYGVPMLEQLKQATPLALEVFDWAGRSTTFPTGGLHVNFDQNRMSFWLAPDFAGVRTRIESWFPGIPVTFWGDRYESHLQAAPGLSLPAADERAIAREIVGSLTREIRGHADGVIKVMQVFKEEGKTVKVNPYALRDDPLTLSVAARRALLEEWFPDLLAEKS